LPKEEVKVFEKDLEKVVA